MSRIETWLKRILGGVAVVVGLVVIVVSTFGIATTTCVSTAGGTSSCTTSTSTVAFVVVSVLFGIGFVGVGVTTLWRTSSDNGVT